MINTYEVDTPVGALTIAVRDDRVVALGFSDHFDGLATSVRERFPDETWATEPTEAAAALDRYVAGDLDAFEGIEVDLAGTDFQRLVWTTLRSIPPGQTWSYGELARAVGNPGAMRAVGAANGANPISVLLPCHRVIRSDGSLGGYGGGLDRKVWLLEHEGARTPRLLVK